MKLVYDIVGVPNGLDIGNLTKIFEQHHVVFWDSVKGGTKPKLYSKDETPADLCVVDLEGKELNIERFSKEFKEAEFWDKELYNCKNSPIYFFKNYGTSVWPHTDADMSAYMESIGMEKVVAKDDKEAKKLWDKQKKRMKKATAHYTIEFLKERKAVIDVLKLAYDKDVLALEEAVSPHVRLFDSNNVPLGIKKQCGNLTEKIRKCLPVMQKYSDKYRTKKGKWDSPMLFVTDYRHLLQIYYDILKDDGRISDVVGAQPGDTGGAAV